MAYNYDVLSSKSSDGHFGSTTFLKVDKIGQALAKHSPTKMQE